MTDNVKKEPLYQVFDNQKVSDDEIQRLIERIKKSAKSNPLIAFSIYCGNNPGAPECREYDV